MTGKFNNVRDAALYQLTLEGWATLSDGNVEAPTGWFALILNPPQDMNELMQAFDFNESLRERLTGYFVLTENDQGFVTVESFDSEAKARAQYHLLVIALLRWEGSDDDA